MSFIFEWLGTSQASSAPLLTLYIKSVCGTTFPLEVCPSQTTLRQLKERIAETSPDTPPIPPSSQRLLYHGVPLDVGGGPGGGDSLLLSQCQLLIADSSSLLVFDNRVIPPNSKEEQRAVVQELWPCQQQRMIGKEVFLVSAKWWASFQAFLWSSSFVDGECSLPGTIDNLPLIEEDPWKAEKDQQEDTKERREKKEEKDEPSEGEKMKKTKEEPKGKTGGFVMRRNLTEGKEFQVMDRALWDYLRRIYGGGPAISREVYVARDQYPFIPKVDLYPLSLTCVREVSSSSSSSLSSSSSSSLSSSIPSKKGGIRLTISKFATVKRLKEELMKRFGVSLKAAEDCRVWDNFGGTRFLLLEDENECLSKYHIIDGNEVLLEEKQKDGRWPPFPSDWVMLSPIAASALPKGSDPGAASAGLGMENEPQHWSGTVDTKRIRVDVRKGRVMEEGVMFTEEKGYSESADIWKWVLEVVEDEQRNVTASKEKSDRSLRELDERQRDKEKYRAELAKRVLLLQRELAIAEKGLSIAEREVTVSNEQFCDARRDSVAKGKEVQMIVEQKSLVEEQLATLKKNADQFEQLVALRDLRKLGKEGTRQLLKEAGLGKYLTSIEDNHVMDATILCKLTNGKLQRKLGIKLLRERAHLRMTLELVKRAGVIRMAGPTVSPTASSVGRRNPGTLLDPVNVAWWTAENVNEWLVKYQSVPKDVAEQLRLCGVTGEMMMYCTGKELQSLSPLIDLGMATRLTALFSSLREAFYASIKRGSLSPSPSKGIGGLRGSKEEKSSPPITPNSEDEDEDKASDDDDDVVVLSPITDHRLPVPPSPMLQYGSLGSGPVVSYDEK